MNHSSRFSNTAVVLLSTVALACFQAQVFGVATSVPLSNPGSTTPAGDFGTNVANLLSDNFTYDPNLSYDLLPSIDPANLPDTNFSGLAAYASNDATRFWRADVTLDGGDTLDLIDLWGRSNAAAGEEVRHQGLTFSFYTGTSATGTLLGTSDSFDVSDPIAGVAGSAYGRFDVSDVLNATQRGMVGSFRIDHADFTTGTNIFLLQEVRAATGEPVNPTPVALVNRDTGIITITNGTEARNLVGYTVTSASGTLDATAWDSITDGANNSSLDADAWIKASVGITNGSNLTETELPGGGDPRGFAFAASQPIDLGPIWQKHANEDVVVTLFNDDGSTTAAAIIFEGNSGAAFPAGDLDFNNTIDLLDWAEFRSGFGGTFPNLTGGETYAMGDFDSDLDVDLTDFRIFEQAYNAANPQQSLAAAILAVPEPSTALLAIFGSMVACMRRNRSPRRSRSERSATSFGKNPTPSQLAMMVPALTLVLLVATSVSAQTFSVIAAPDNPSTDVTSTSVFGPGFEAANLFNASISAADIDVTSIGAGDEYASRDVVPIAVFIDNDTSITTNWLAYSQREAAADHVGAIELWFSDTDFGGQLPITAPDAIANIADRTNPTVLKSFQLSSTVSGRYAALNLIPAPGAILFPGGRELRFLQGPDQFTLEVDTATGEMKIKNSDPLAQSLAINGYEISSAAGSLTSTGWTGLGGQAGFPEATSPDADDGWVQGAQSGNNGNLLTEAYFLGGSNVGIGADLSLGGGYNTAVGAQDLTFSYSLEDGAELFGAVEYIRPEADYDLDGDVDGNDFLFWQRGISTNNGSAGDLATWESQYGSGVGPLVVGSSSSITAVPEPGSSSLLMLGVFFLALKRRLLPGLSFKLVAVTASTEQESSTMCSRRLLRRSLIFAAAFIVMSMATREAEAATADRSYLLGDNSTEVVPGPINENGTPGGTVVSTLDHAGVSGVDATFTDLAAVGTPTYVDVGPAGLNRPGTSGASVGIDFDGSSEEYVSSFDGFGNPVDGGGSYADTINYQGIINHYMQGWVRPTLPGTPGQRQMVIRDTQQFRIFLETDQGGNHRWGHFSSFHSNLSSETVAFNEWTHVAHAHGGGGGILYINGVAVDVINGFFVPNGGDFEMGTPGGLSIALGADITGVNTFFDFFTGQLDDFDIRVAGDNSDLTAGADYGAFDLEVDNAFIAALVDDGTLVAGDMNGDGVVNGNGTLDPNVDDVAFFVEHYLDQNVTPDGFVVGDLNSRTQLGDLNYSGTTNLFDWFILVSNHQDEVMAASLDLESLLSAAAVPEPTTLLLLSISVVGVLSTRRHRS